MNALESRSITSPFNKTDECAVFVIDNPAEGFVLSGIATKRQRYTFSLWLKADAVGSVSVGGDTFPATTEWKKHSVTFTATSEDVPIVFDIAGTYYIYHAQLEIGNKATDWTPAHEDVDESIGDVSEEAASAKNAASDAADRVVLAESTIRQLADSIASLVRDGNGGSLIRQDTDGLWYFNIGDIEKNISDTANELDDLSGIVLGANGEIDVLKSTAAALQKRTEYVRSYTDENGQPCLELGEGDSKFKVRITNTEIQFEDDGAIPTRINRQMLVIEKAMVRNELQFGDDEAVDGVWTWKRRSNGNLGLVWKDVSE